MYCDPSGKKDKTSTPNHSELVFALLGGGPPAPGLLPVVLNKLLPSVPLAVVGHALLWLGLGPLVNPALFTNRVNVVVAELEDTIRLVVLGQALLVEVLRTRPLVLPVLVVELLEVLRMVQLPVVRPAHLDGALVACGPAALQAGVAARVLRSAPWLVLLRAPVEVVAAITMLVLAALLCPFANQLPSRSASKREQREGEASHSHA